MEVKTEAIVDQSQESFGVQWTQLEKIKSLLPSSQVEAVGALAVPMIGRPEIDLMVISKRVVDDSDILVKNGYKQGPIVDGVSFFKMVVGGFEVAVQIIPLGHKMIAIHRNIIALLQRDGELRKRYEEFKRTLSGLSREEYKREKGGWIDKNIKPLL